MERNLRNAMLLAAGPLVLVRVLVLVVVVPLELLLLLLCEAADPLVLSF